jgi:iron complex transport system substrate-binding protein
MSSGTGPLVIKGVRRLGAILCFGAALTVAGCQATDTDDPPETSKPLKVEHALGTTKVPGQAKRPVALYPSELDDALALGVTPAGAAGGALPRYLGDRTRTIRLVGPVPRPDLALIQSLEPDVILSTKRGQGRLYRRLRRIAPTVAIDERVDWKPNLRQDGEALGHPDEAEHLLNRYDRKAALVRRLIRSRGAPLLPPAVRRALSRPFVASVMDDVGLPHPRPRDDLLPGARPGPFDAWTLGTGYLAATRILADLMRFSAR